MKKTNVPSDKKNKGAQKEITESQEVSNPEHSGDKPHQPEVPLDAHLEGLTKFSFGKKADHDESDTDFMSPVTGAYRQRPKRWGPILLYAIVAFFAIAIGWSYFAELDQVTRAQGFIVASGQTKIIDHLEGGIVKEIKVKEGDVVEAGQVLLVVDSTVEKEKYEEGLRQYYRTEAQIARLKALTDGKPFVMPEEVKKNAPEIAAKEELLYTEAQGRLSNEKQIASNELEQHRQEAIQATEKVKQLENRLELSQKEANLMEPYVKSGVVPQMEWLKVQRDIGDTKGELAGARVAVPKADAAVLEAQRKLDEVEITLHTEENRELREAQLRWADIKDNTVKDLDRLNRTEIRSPVRGTIKELKINTIGGVIQPGKDLIAIVPLEDQLLVEAQVQPADVAFLRPGMKAIVKVTAYDYGIYGGLDATLLDISADTLVDEKSREQKQFFRIRLKTDKNYIGKEDKRLPISPGMTAQVDILTGKRTVWQYLMKPLEKASENALTEK